ncbi:GDSL-type esterase/lipase family protein [Kitasatospora sp. NPDC059571]|uniref:DUF459 domain-containing protein n=1 Tax=Kitasatospora sp. NPDC059571 TaxID=3346871 RepID=UPI003684EBAE
MERDPRVCFVGDSFTAGVGDPTARGWAGRLAARTLAGGGLLTWYNLGVRRNTSADIAERWEDECARRLPDGTERRVVLCFGVNDTVHEDGRPRVAPDASAANLARILDRAAGRGWTTLFVGPPPVADPAHNERTALLDERYAALCRDAGVPHVAVHHALRASTAWMHEVRTGDGAHPAEAGYDAFADLVEGRWHDWLAAG